MATRTTDHFDSIATAREVARAALAPMPVVPQGKDWDRFIIAMRLILPVSAFIVGSVTLAWPFLNDTEVSFTLSQDEVAKSDGVVHMTNLKYVGTDAGNRLFQVEASSGQQEDAADPRIRLTDIRAQMELEPGLPAFVHARTGIYRMKEGTLSLLGGVSVRSTSGYELEIAGAEIDLKSHTATAAGTITGASELGQLEAGRMEILVDSQEGIFTDGVKLHLLPRRPGSKTGARGGNTGQQNAPHLTGHSNPDFAG